jgi:hypothetical protein
MDMKFYLVFVTALIPLLVGMVYYNRAVSKAGLGDTINACVDIKKSKSLGFAAATELYNKICK